MDRHRTMPAKTPVFLYCLLILSTAMIVYTAVMVDSITYAQSRNYDNHLRYHVANALFREGTDLLTDAVRRYVVTSKPEFMKQYFDEARKGRHRDRALRMVGDLHIAPSLKATLIGAMKLSKGLMYTEYHAMHLIETENAKELLHKELATAETEQGTASGKIPDCRIFEMVSVLMAHENKL